MIFIAYLGHIEVKHSSCKFLKNSEGQINNGTIALNPFQARPFECAEF